MLKTHLHFNDLILDLHNFTVIKNGETISLTGKEFSILKLFMTNNKPGFYKGRDLLFHVGRMIILVMKM